MDDDAAEPWLRDQIRSLVMHRLPTSSNSETRFRFGDDEENHPLGRLLMVDGGRMASSYRIKDGEIRVVNRNLGEQSMTLIVLANESNVEKRTLPNHYVVEYWDGATGRLTHSEAFQDRWISNRVLGSPHISHHLDGLRWRDVGENRDPLGAQTSQEAVSWPRRARSFFARRVEFRIKVSGELPRGPRQRVPSADSWSEAWRRGEPGA